MGLAEAVPARDERHGLLVIHCHALEGLTNVDSRGGRIGLAVRPFGIHIDESHLHRGERIFELPVAGVALVLKPNILLSPVNRFVRLPRIRSARPLKPKVFQKPIDSSATLPARMHQGRPRRSSLAYFCFSGHSSRRALSEVGIVRPRIEQREALLTGASAAPAIAYAVGARGVPRHPE